MRRNAIFLLGLVVIGAVGCARRDTHSDAASNRAPVPGDTFALDASAPVFDVDAADAAAIEAARGDTSWRSAARYEMMQRGPGRPRALPVDTSQVMGRTGAPSDSLPALTLQVWLDRLHFSPGAIDGRAGKNTAKALYWFQDAYGVTPTGELDLETRRLLERLAGQWEPVVPYRVTAADAGQKFVPLGKDMYDKAKQSCLCYESLLEAMGEKFHTTPEFLTTLNSGLRAESLKAGEELLVPNVDSGWMAKGGVDSTRVIDRVVVSRRGFYAHAIDADGNILFHFPSTLGSKYDPSPEGNLRITGIAQNPTFHYQPKLFADVPDDKPEANLPAGPNSPVGVVWMQLSKENYGIHGTATPETIGYAASHGCIRLTNWDAATLARYAKRGVRVEFTNQATAAVSG
ncbi:MAG: L,D-transpeptidase family protein [Candidatus Eisenbacteria bacterium]|nr:L,D-transpeptidase family protein [Candidatus Eisenbacteria bacterium]